MIKILFIVNKFGPISINVDNTEIFPSNEAKNLGFIFNSQLIFEKQIK